MTDNSRVTLRWAAAAVITVLLVATGALTAYLLTRAQRPAPNATSDEPPIATSHSAGHGTPAPPGGTAAAPGETWPDVTVTLTKDAVERAGITVVTVDTTNATTAMRLPGVVEPNAYKQVVVTPTAAGRVARVLVELGQRVERGQTMARIFSPELAEAHTRLISARAELAAHELELQRTEKLVEIGAASRQELERIHAQHTAQTAEVQSVRARLELLGVPPAALDGPVSGKLEATIDVPAPNAGVVTERLANVGLNVDLATKLFTVVDLSTVWVVADLYEKDFSRVRVGSLVTVTTAAYPDLAIQGRIGYIDPRVSPDTRTAKVRVEVPNARNELRLGMLAEVSVQGRGQTSVPVIPRSAVQNVGDRQVVYLVDPKAPGEFVEREVRLGDAAGDQAAVLAGLKTGDVIVSEGSFYVRAERERLGLRAAPAPTVDTPSVASPPDAPRVTVSEQGFQPARVAVRLGGPVRITFLRTTDATCAKEVVIPAFNLKRALPLNEPVTVEFTPKRTGDVEFVCGMGMLRGTIVVQ